MEKKFWFVRKEYGWGWTPGSWKGWLATFVFAGANILYPLFGEKGYLPFSTDIFFLVLISSTAAFIGLCFWKGESPRWQWGKSG